MSLAGRLWFGYDRLWGKLKNPRAEAYRDECLRRILERLDGSPGWGADLGCGDGRHGNGLKRAIVGVDAAPKPWKGKTTDACIRADLRFLPLRGRSVVRVYSISVLELVREIDHVAGEIRRITPEGSVVLITVPNFRSAHFGMWYLRDIVLRRMKVRQYRWTPAHIEHVFARHDLRLVERGGILSVPFALLEHLWGAAFRAAMAWDRGRAASSRPAGCSYWYFVFRRDPSGTRI